MAALVTAAPPYTLAQDPPIHAQSRLWIDPEPDALTRVDYDDRPVTQTPDTPGGPIHSKPFPYYRALVKFPTGNCQTAFDYDIALTRLNPNGGASTTMLGKVECGQDFLVRGLRPGSYRLELLQEYATSDDRDWAVIDFEVGEGNVKLSIPGYVRQSRR